MQKLSLGRNLRSLFLLAFAASVFGAVQLVTSFARAVPAPQTWFDVTKLPQVGVGAVMPPGEANDLYTQHMRMGTNRPCDVEDDEGCWYDTTVGQQVERSGYTMRDAEGATVFPREYVIDENRQNTYPVTPLVATPNPNAFLELVPQDPSDNVSQYKVYFRTGGASMIVPLPEAPGEAPFVHFLGGESNVPLLTHGGQPWVVDENVLYSQVGYATNGAWMSIFSTDGYVVVVNLNDFSTRTIRVDEFAGTDTFGLTTVSDDGRYLAVSVSGGQLLVYDLAACHKGAAVSGVAAETCASRVLDPVLQMVNGDDETYPEGGGIPQFTSTADVLKYTTTGTDQQYYIWPPNVTISSTEDSTVDNHPVIYSPTPQELNYIALGDSYASGEGEGNDTFFGGTDVHDVNMCHLSRVSYPYLIDRDIWINSLTSVHSVACSGAKITDVLDGPQHAQLPSRNTLGYWLPGAKKQLQYVEDNKPNIITISMSGNDIGFSEIIKSCIRSATCYDTREDRDELVNLINRQFDRLVSMYQQIQHTAAPGAHIYVVGYPSIVKTGGNCGSNVHLDSKETEFANNLIEYLNLVIKKATQRAGVSYVDTEKAFVGNRLCEARADFAVNGITIGHDTNPISDSLPFNLISKGSFHPTVYGHELLALAIELQTSNFTKQMPKPNAAVTEPTVSDAAALLMGVPSTGRPVRTLQPLPDSVDDVLYKKTDSIAQLNVNTINIGGLQADSTVQAWLHSDPINLGTYSVDANGNAKLTVALPDSAPVGFHMLYLDVTDADGQEERLFKTVYVAATPDDLDGNGMPNSLEPCLIFEVPDGQLVGDGYDCSGNALITTASGVGSPIHAPTPLKDGPESFSATSVNGIGASDVSTLIPSKDYLSAGAARAKSDHGPSFLGWLYATVVSGIVLPIIYFLYRKSR